MRMYNVYVCHTVLNMKGNFSFASCNVCSSISTVDSSYQLSWHWKAWFSLFSICGHAIYKINMDITYFIQLLSGMFPQ